MSEMSHFPVRLMSFLHTPFKIKCKYAVFTAIVTKERRPDATRNANRLTQEVNIASFGPRMPAATFLRKTMIKPESRDPSLLYSYGLRILLTCEFNAFSIN